MTGATGIVTDPGFLDHDPGRDHPENIGRMIAVDRAVSCLNGSLVPIQGYSIDLKDLEGIHSPEYIRKILASASRKFTALTRDTFASNGSCHAARMAAGSCRKAVESVLTGQVRNAFALVRPPGHHAEFSRPMGYCLFNNMALAASFALNHFHLNRLLIVDWDVHHGNGTQHIFEADPRVLFFSVHQSGHFPGTGHVTEAGRGRGEGYTVNVPLPAGCGNAEYEAVFHHLLVPVVESYLPEMILVSAGFDPHFLDPMGGMRVTPEGFAALTRILMSLADRICGGRLVLVLEGGYHAEALAESIAAVLRELTGQTISSVLKRDFRMESKAMQAVMNRCRHVLDPFWQCFSDG